ncbi:MAG TPA: mannosyltransferase family protein [Ktedonobacterales bacterium]
MKVPATLAAQKRRVAWSAWRERLQKTLAWSARADVRAALLATLGLRLASSLIAALAWINGPEAGHPTGNLLYYLTIPWLHWDTVWYLVIAHDGYAAYGSTAFLPLYPLLVHLVGIALGGQPLAAALLISTVATFGALLCLYRLAARLSAAPNAAPWTLVVAVFLPVSFFLVAGYTEALFLWAALGALLAFLEGRWGRLALLCVVATLTRHQGLLLSLLVVPMFASALLARARQRQTDASWRAQAASLWKPALAAAAGPAAYLAWLLVVGLALRAPLPWEPLVAANGWNLHTTWPGAGVIADLAALAQRSIPSPLGLSVPLDAGAAILAGITIIFAARRLPPAIMLYLIGCWCLALVKVQAEGLTISAARYLLPALPLAVLPGAWLASGRPAVRLLWLALGSILLSFLTWEFATGGWIN